MILTVDTPLECYLVGPRKVWVKREDLACPPPGPPFSKVRGLVDHMSGLKDRGVTTVGYTETSVSMAGWGVAWCARKLGMRAVIFDPQYKQPPSILECHRGHWREHGAEIAAIRPGMARVNHNICRRLLSEQYGPGAVLLDLGLPLAETVEATASVWRGVVAEVRPGTTVVNIGSGTICAGLLRGWQPGDGTIIGVLGRTGECTRKGRRIADKAGRLCGGLMGPELKLIDPGWEYTEPSVAHCPFPCHRYYDLKAWQWLTENLSELADPILFWNIGSEALK